MGLDDLPLAVRTVYEVYEWKHASAILKTDFPSEWQDLIEMLQTFKLRKTWIVEPGGNKTKLAAWVDAFLGARGWRKKFTTEIHVDELVMESPLTRLIATRTRLPWSLSGTTRTRFLTVT